MGSKSNVITNVPVSIIKFGNFETEIGVTISSSLEFGSIEIGIKLGGNSVKIVKYDEESEKERTLNLKVDGSAAKVYSGESGSYGAHNGIVFRNGLLSFSILEATAEIVEDRLVLLDVRLG